MTRESSTPHASSSSTPTPSPSCVKRWLLGPHGWSMPVCEIDLRVGGAYRCVWRRDSTGTEMGMGGVYREIVRPERIVSTEKFDDAWYGRSRGHARPDRAGRQDHAHADGAVRVARSARRRPQVRHGEGRGRELRPAGGAAGEIGIAHGRSTLLRSRADPSPRPVVYLRLLDVPVPGSYGPTADEQTRGSSVWRRHST